MRLDMTSGANWKVRVTEWLEDESGNATVDWVLLVGMAMAFAIVALGSISGGVEVLGEKTGTEVSAIEVGKF